MPSQRNNWVVFWATSLLVIFMGGMGKAHALEQTDKGVRALSPAEYDLWYKEKNRQPLQGVWRLWKIETKGGLPLSELKKKPYEWWAKNFSSQATSQLVPLDWQQRYPKITPRKWSLPEARAGMYGRSFRVPKGNLSKRAILHFDWVNSECTVYVNGKRVGGHRNFFTQGRNVDAKYHEDFELDITNYLHTEKENLLQVLVFCGPKVKVWGGMHVDYGGIVGPIWIDYRPTIFMKKIYLAPRLKTSSLAIDLIRDTSSKKAATSTTWKFTITPWRGEGKSYESKQTLTWAKNRAQVNLPMPEARLWDTENPFLYKLEIRNATGEVVGRERFGFRSFQTRGEKFLLNNQPVWLRGLLWSSRPTNTFSSEIDYNYGNYLRTWLRLIKEKGNVNFIRIHNGGASQVFFNICDELGLLVCDDFDVPGEALAKDDPRRRVDFIARCQVMRLFTPEGTILPGAIASFQNFVRNAHNHPSVVMFDTGNERSPDIWFAKYAKAFYKIVHQVDRQDRPVSSWGSGPHFELARRKWSLPTDYLDFHNYDATLAGGYWENTYKSQKHEYDQMKKITNSPQVPIIDGETIGTMMRLPRLKVVAKWFASGASARQVFLRWAENRGKWNPNLINNHGLNLSRMGIRAFRSENAVLQAHGERLKVLLETQRRELDFLQGIVCLGATDDFYWRGQSTSQYWRGESASQGILDPARTVVKQVLPFVKQLGIAYAPVFASAYPFRRNVQAGETIRLKILVHNGELTARSGLTLRATILDNQGKELAVSEKKLAPIQPDERQKYSLSISVPATAVSNQTGHLEISLEENGKRFFTNPYTLNIIAPAPVQAGKFNARIAVYNGSEKPESFVTPLLAGAGISVRHAATIKEALAANTIIICPDSLSEDVEISSSALRAWVENGGRLLVLKQSRAGIIPFLTEYRYNPANPRPFVDVLVPEHPVFAGLPLESFRDWSGDGTLFSTWINQDVLDLDKTVLAAAAASPSVNKMAFGMLASEVRVGKGTIFFSQFDLGRHYKTELGARRYLNNLLSYVTSNDFGKNASAPGGKRKTVQYYASKRCVFLPFGTLGNSSLGDKVAGDGKGGWADLGGASINSLRPGVYRFHGVNYQVVAGGRINKWRPVIVLGGSIRPNLPKVVTGIPVNKTLAAISFLHTAAFVKAKKGEKLGAYIVHYADGSTLEIPLLNQINIDDWWHKRDCPQALVAKILRGRNKNRYAVYVTTWKNPQPEKSIASLEMRSAGNAILGFISITGILPN